MAKSMELGMMPNAEGSMNIASAIAFDTAEREYNDAWSGRSSTRSIRTHRGVWVVLLRRCRVRGDREVDRLI